MAARIRGDPSPCLWQFQRALARRRCASRHVALSGQCAIDRPAIARWKIRDKGLNENLARELLELHTWVSTVVTRRRM
ncbi:MAG: DUF1800 family protein [Betaproteobacteria bacterium]|nr:DUF1800 family protein [Betaproteobacteria bacterium]